MSKIEFCAACGASLSHGVQACEECGQRRGAPRSARGTRPAVAPARGRTHRGERRQRRRGGGNWWLPLAGILLLAAAGVVLWRMVGDQVVTSIGGREATAATKVGESAVGVESPVSPLVRKRQAEPYAPLLRVCVDSFEPLLAIPTVRAGLGVWRQRDGVGRAAVMPMLERALEAMPRPFELDVVLTEREDLVLVIRLPSRERVVHKHWSGLLVGSGIELGFDGGSIGRYASPFGAAFEAVIGDTDHFVLIANGGRPSDSIAWLSRHFGAAPVLDADLQRVWNGMPARGVRALVSLRRLAATAKTPIEPWLREWFGKGSLAVAVQCHFEAQRPVVDVTIDAGAPGSLVGELLKGSTVPRLMAWLPDGAAEFVAGALDLDTVDRVLAMPLLKGSLPDLPAVRELYEFATGSWDGQLALLSDLTTAAQALDPESEVPLVALLGAADASAAMARVAERLETKVVEGLTPDAPVRCLLGEAGEELLLIAARGDVLWLAGTDAQSRRLLRESLQTGGKQSAAGAWTQRVGSGLPPAPDLLWVGSHLGNLAGKVAIRHAMGQVMSDMQRDLAAELARVPGTYAGWMALGPDGWRLRNLY
jgi:hypothetical protein